MELPEELKKKIKDFGTDLVNAALGMKNHLKLLNPEAQKEPNHFEILGTAMAKIVSEGVKGNGFYEKLEDINTKVDEMHEHLM